MTNLEIQILEAVKIGESKSNLPRHVHIKYLPEVLALVAKGKLELISSSPTLLVKSVVTND